MQRASVPLISLPMAVFSRPGMISREIANEVGPLILVVVMWEFQPSRSQEKAFSSQRQDDCIYCNGYFDFP